MSEPVWHDTKIRAKCDPKIVSLTKQVIRALSNKGRELPKHCRIPWSSYVSKLVVDGKESTEEEFADTPGFDTVEFSFEYFSAEAYDLYLELLHEVGGLGPGFGAIVHRSDVFSNSFDLYGDVEQADFDPSISGDEWSTDIDPVATVTLEIGDLCSMLDCEPRSLWNALRDVEFRDGGDSILAELLGNNLAEAIIGKEAELEGYDLGSDVGSNLIEYAPETHTAIAHSSLDEGDPIWDVYRMRQELSSEHDSDLFLIEPPSDLAPNLACLEFRLEAGMLRFGSFDDLCTWKATFTQAADKLAKRGGSITLRWKDDFEKDSDVNMFSARDGFKKLTFRTGPNYWSKFEAIEYKV